MAPPEFRMLQLKPQERQGEGGDGCCSKPSLLGWEKSQRIWGTGPLHLHPAPAVSKWDPSSHIQQHLHRPAQHRSVTPATAAVPAKACGYGSNTFQPFTSRCPGVPLRAHPPILLSLPGSFLPSLAAGTGQGKRECQHHGGTAARLARANPPSIRIHPLSSFTSCLGPWGKEERDEQEPRLCQGGQRGEKHTKTTCKNTMYIKKVPVMD